MKLKVIGNRGEWFVHDPARRIEDCGPYTTRDEADEDRQGLQRFLDVEQGRKPKQ